ncbi:hypothetical protein [Scytonema sp. NUACC26]|uniref:hypothetical protein n=1 Tax=Scytonema sp. NUACC26 TaxID=3140176 RepID=UPI0038B411FB
MLSLLLFTSRNPFATVVMAHLAALETSSDRQGRLRQKLALVQRLYSQGFSEKEVLNLLAFIDWMLTLPLDLEREFKRSIEQLEAEQRMQYVTSFERSGIRLGVLEGIGASLEIKFGSEGLSLLPEISQIEDIDQLRKILEGIKTVQTVSELQQIYQLPAK